ncbi:Arv1 protein [Lipomyces oligophaga]|uniref:Arv1 protein n=1 Tax=Lipomyces oligophaga TaxID=45792 RepID=UPI0034CD20AB
MMCIECAHTVTSLYTQYSSKNIRLTACPNCNKFADKYIEHDSVLIFIDLVLIKPQAYRHLAFNRLAISPHLHSTVRRTFVLIALFDVYLTWAQVEKANVQREEIGDNSDSSEIEKKVLSFPVLAQYLYFLAYCLTETFVTHIVLRFFARYAVLSRSKQRLQPNGNKNNVREENVADDTNVLQDSEYDPNTITIALLIASATKLFPMLMVIWSYDIPAAAKAVGWAVNVSTVEALDIVLMCGHLRAIELMTLAVLIRRLVARLLIWIVVGGNGVGSMVQDELTFLRGLFPFV